MDVELKWNKKGAADFYNKFLDTIIAFPNGFLESSCKGSENGKN